MLSVTTIGKWIPTSYRVMVPMTRVWNEIITCEISYPMEYIIFILDTEEKGLRNNFFTKRTVYDLMINTIIIIILFIII